MNDFFEIARSVSLKPIIAIKSGTSEAGTKAISSHTCGSLAGSDTAVSQRSLKHGIIRANTVEELFDYAKF